VFENGELIALEGFISDISEKKLAENALRESEEKYRLIAQNTSDGIFILDGNNEMTYVSPAYKKQMGFDPDDEVLLDQTRIYSILHPDDRDVVFQRIFDAIAAHEKSLIFTYRALHQKRQTYIWLEDKVSFTYTENGKLLQAQGISRDITDRKIAEAAVKQSEEKYRSLIESSDSSIVMIDADGNYLYLNNIAAAPFGMHPDSMVGMNVKQLFPPDQAESIVNDVAKVLDSNEGFIKEVFVNLAGKKTWFRVSIQPVRNESGNAIAALMYSTNITESKLSEEKIRQSEKKYKVLFNDSPDPYLIIRDEKFIECNKAAELLLKADRSEIIGKNPAEISPEFQPDGKKSTQLAAELLEKAFSAGSVSFEWVHLRSDGSEIFAHINLISIDYDGETVLFTTWQDLTERRAAELQLRKLSRAVEQSPISIVITNVDGNIEYANPLACETTGYSLEELIGKNPRVLKSGDTTHDEYSQLWNNITTGKEWKGVFHNKRKNGQFYWESSTIAPITDAAGNITHFVALKEDITERREMQLALQESQERFGQIAEQSQTVIWEVDANGMYTYVSQIAEKVWGYSPFDLIGKMHFYDLHPEEHRETYKKLGLELLNELTTLRDFENPIQRKDGTVIWVSTNGIPVTNHQNEFTGYRGADIDITNRKAAEEELRKFRTISDQANYGTAIANLDGTLAYANEAFAAMHGWEVKDLIGKSLTILHKPEQLEKVYSLLEVIKTQGGFSAEEVWRERIDGSVFPSLMNTKLIFDQNNQPQFMAASAIDITELKLAEESLRRSEETLNHAQEIAKMGSWEYDLFTDSVTWSKNYYKLIGLDPSEPPLSLNEIRRIVHPDDRTVFETKLSRMQDSQILESIYFRLLMPDESIKWIQANMVPFFEDGRLVRVSGVSIDITEKKEAEEKIREQNIRLNAIMDAMPDMIFVSDKDGNYLEYFKSKINALQNNYEHLVGSNLRESFDETTTQLHLEKIKECLEVKDIITYEYPKVENGLTKYFEGRIVAMDDNKVLRFVREITEKKFQEKEIKKLTLAIEQSPVAIVITDLKANIQYVSPAFYNTTGYSSKEAIGLNANVLKSGKTPDAVYKDLWKTITQGKAWEGEWINKKKNGEFYWENISITPIFDEDGVVSSYLAIKQDISERKKAEEEILELNASLEQKVETRTRELAKSNDYLTKEIEERKAIEEALLEKSTELENFFSVALDLLCIADHNGNFLKVNQSWSDILGYNTEELQNRQFLEFVHPDDLQPTLDAMTLLSGQNPILDFTNRYRTRNGDYRFIEWHSVPVGDKIYAAARDITKRKRNELFEQELLQLSTKLTGIPLSEINNALNMALERIGRFLDADRSYIIEIDYNRHVYDNTYEWCNEGISAEIDNLQGVPFDSLPRITEVIQKKDIVFIPSVSGLPEAWNSEREAFEVQDIKSVVLIPMIADNEVNGFVGLDSVRNNREYDQDEINILKVWSSMLASLINDRKTESLIEQTRQNYETFFNTIDDFLFVFNESGFIVDMNNTVCTRLGYDSEELKNQIVLMVRLEEHHDEALRTIGMMLNGELGVCTLPLVTKSGEQIPVETRVKRGFWNGQEVIFGVSKDISQIKLSEQKFSTAFQSNAAGMAISYYDSGEYVDVNNAFIELLGYGREELIGKTGNEFNIFVDANARNKILHDLNNGIPVRKLEIKLRSKEGSIKTGLVSCDAIFLGSERCLLAVIVDITDRKKAEEELERARVEADKANLAKSEFLSRMSHELRTPMNSILGFAQLLEMGELNAKQKGGVHHIIRSGKHLLDLINEVLDISRIESGRLSISLEPVRIDYLIQEIIDITTPLANAREIKIIITPQENKNLFLQADRQRLKQVLINLINNAIKYNKEKGSVTIKTTIIPGYDKLNNRIRIAVSDTGLGISETDIPKLFIPFERIGAEKTTTEGTGLGLAVVKKLMDAMGGNIGVESVIGEGSVFWIELPQTNSPKEYAAANGGMLEKEEIASESISGVILYIEDNVSNIELVEEVLVSQRNGIKLFTELLGSKALEKAIEVKPDLILLDLNLPDIHGSEVLSILKADERTKGIPVVIVSADAMPNQLMKLLKAGARNYLTKPLDVQNFLRIVDQFLSKE
jgi:PAS domain S-box-containing protein